MRTASGRLRPRALAALRRCERIGWGTAVTDDHLWHGLRYTGITTHAELMKISEESCLLRRANAAAATAAAVIGLAEENCACERAICANAGRMR